jgi:hypothetical protein
MKITEEQQREILEAAKPLIRWLNDNCHPHCMAIVDLTSIELVEAVARNQTDEFLHD